MYHCKIHFYLLGRQRKAFDIIKTIPPLEHFTHSYSESEMPEEAMAAKADVILADLRALDAKVALQTLLQAKRREAELILLAEKGQVDCLLADLGEIKDIWICPMAEEEIKFRFLKWQEAYKLSKDLWEASHYLESTINNVPNLVWYKDRNGIHEKVNDSFCRTVNKTKQQVEGRGHAYIWDVEHDDPACIESEREVMTSKKTCISEETIQTGEGLRTLETYKSPLYDLDGSVMGTVGVAIDVTQERIYKKEILQKNETLEKILTTIDCGVIRHSMDGTGVFSINRAALKILGYESQEELMADGFLMVAGSVLDEDKPKLRASIQSLEREGDMVSTEYRVQHKNGEILHVMGNVKLLKEGGRLFYQRFLLDCTKQKQQEKKRERRQMELVQALAIDYNVVCSFDLDTDIGILLRGEKDGGGVFVPVSDGQIFFKQSMERYIQEFVHEEDQEALRQFVSVENLKNELAEKRTQYANYRTVIDGKTEYYQLKAVRAGKWDERHSIVLGLRSVDEEIRSEMEQKNLLEDALQQANQANKAKSVFLSNMSHDIRTPMNAIVGFTSLATVHIDQKEKVAEYLNKIMMSGNHLLSLINDVLDMSRIESGKMHLDEKPCSLSNILQGLRNILQADVHAKQLDLYMDAADIRDEEVYCDKLRLNQVLLNLLSNAVKYTQAGGMISMRVSERAGAPEGYASYEFHIRDTGIGMSEEFVKHIFEPFEREKTSTISGIQGTGLGMAITKNIVDLMHGTISVKSEQGKGTEVTVRFTFRLHSVAKKPQEPPKSNIAKSNIGEPLETLTIDKSEKSDNIDNIDSIVENEKFDSSDSINNMDSLTEEPKQGHTGRILLAEDNEINQEIAAAILEDAGFTTEIADNGQIAVDMLKGSEPGYYRLILMDVRMPVMDGYEATKAIRKLENRELASIPILAMTANAFEEDKQEALECGMDGHLAKPIDVKVLLETLERVLES